MRRAISSLEGSRPSSCTKLTAGADELVDGLDHVHRDTDGAGLIRDGAGDGLPDPPGGIGRELVAAAIFELIDCLHEADVALLNQVEELQSAVGVLLRDRNDETKVGLNQLALGLLRIHIALDHLALGAAELDDGNAGLLLQALEIDVAVLLLPAILLLQFLTLGSVELLVERFDLPLKRAHDLDGLVDLIEQALALLRRVLELANDARDVDLLAGDHPARLARFAGLGLYLCNGFELFFKGSNLLLVAHDGVDAAGGRLDARLHHIFGELFFVKGNYFLDVADAALEVLAQAHNLANDHGRTRQRLEHAHLPALNALGDLNLALAGEQRYGAHLAQVHADRVVGFFERTWCQVQLDVFTVFVEFLVGAIFRAVEQIDALGANGGDQIVKIVGIVHIFGQHVIHVSVGQIALFLAGIDQVCNFVVEFVFNGQSAHISCAEILDSPAVRAHNTARLTGYIG